MSPFARWAYFVARRRRAVLIASTLVIVAGFALAPVFRANVLGLGYETPGSESDTATRFAQERSGIGERSVVVVSSKNPGVDEAELRAALEQSIRLVEEEKDVVARVLPPGTDGGGQISRDGQVATAAVAMTGPIADRQEISEELQAELDEAIPAGFEVDLTGPSPLIADLIRVEEKDLLVAETVGLPIAFVLLLIALGSVVRAGLPLLLAISGLGVTLGILAILTLVADFNIFVETMAALVGLGIGIDYAMLIVRRYRDERASGGGEPVDALATTLATAGRTVVFSGSIVAVSFVPLAITRLPFFAESAVAIVIVVAMMVVGALTLLPALLLKLDHRLDRLSVPKLRQQREGGGWARWARWVMRRPWPVLVAGVALLLVLALPTLGLKTGTDLNARAMEGEPAADGLATLERSFPAASLAPVEVVLRTEDGGPIGSAPKAAEDVMSSEGRLGEVSTVPLGDDATLLVATPTVAVDSDAAADLVGDVRDDLAAAVPTGVEPLVTGTTAETVDYTDETSAKTPAVIGFALLLSFLLLTWVFRSPVLALKAIILNLLSIGAAFGLVVLVFQDGHGESLLGFTSLGYIQGWMPITLFVMLFGLSMDYEVFMVSRMREEYERSGKTTEAVALGLERTGGVVTSAAAIMVAIFGSFVLTSIPEIKQMGFGLAVAVLIDATIVRAALVPAFMRIAGRWNWWMPRRLDRLLPRFEH